MIEECTQVMMRYATAQDHGQSEEFAALFAVDAVWERSDGSRIVGRDQILAHNRQVTARRTNWIRHLITTIDVRSTDSRQARVIAYVLVYKAGLNGDPQLSTLLEYTTDLAQVDGRWLISRHRSLPAT